MEAFRLGDVRAEPAEIRFGSLGELYLPDSSPIKVPIIVVRGKSDGPTLYVGSTMHGPEMTGAEVIRRITREHVDPKKLRGTIVALPITNPLAFSNHTMNTPQDWYNLNRVFPGNPTGPTSFRLADLLIQQCVSKCDYVMDFHANPSPAMCFSITKESNKTAVYKKSLALAEAFGITNIRMKLSLEPHRAGTLTDVVQGLGKPSLTVELLYWRRIDDTAVKVGVRGTLNIMKHLEMIDGKPEPQSDIWVKKGALSRTEVTATKGGLVYPKAEPGGAVKKGAVIAEIRNPYGDVVEAVKSPVDGFVLAYPMLGNQAVATGDSGAVIGFAELG